jgi:hypothetical protein
VDDGAPDPFVDFQRANPDSAAVSPIVVPPPKPIEKVAPSRLLVPTSKGTLSIGGVASFDYSGSSADNLNGGSSTSSTFFARAGARGSYMLFDRFDLGGTLGLLARDQKGGTSETSFFLEANAGYVLPLTDRIAFAPRLGLGYFHGGATRTVNIAGAATSESTTTNGAEATLYLTGAFQVTPTVQARTGLAITALLGTESISNPSTSLGSSGFFVGIPLEIDWVRPTEK